MSETQQQSGQTQQQGGQSQQQGGQSQRRSQDAGARQGGAVESSGYGRTTVADQVVTKIASMATRDVPGVYDLGGGMARAMGSLRERIPGSRGASASSQGVSVEVGERQAAVDLDIVVDYGVPITEVAHGIRRGVIDAIERMTGLEVVEVNVAVDDVNVPGDEGSSQQRPTRVE